MEVHPSIHIRFLESAEDLLLGLLETLSFIKDCSSPSPSSSTPTQTTDINNEGSGAYMIHNQLSSAYPSLSTLDATTTQKSTTTAARQHHYPSPEDIHTNLRYASITFKEAILVLHLISILNDLQHSKPEPDLNDFVSVFVSHLSHQFKDMKQTINQTLHQLQYDQTFHNQTGNNGKSRNAATSGLGGEEGHLGLGLGDVVLSRLLQFENTIYELLENLKELYQVHTSNHQILLHEHQQQQQQQSQSQMKSSIVVSGLFELCDYIRQISLENSNVSKDTFYKQKQQQNQHHQNMSSTSSSFSCLDLDRILLLCFASSSDLLKIASDSHLGLFSAATKGKVSEFQEEEEEDIQDEFLNSLLKLGIASHKVIKVRTKKKKKKKPPTLYVVAQVVIFLLF
jgi:hypothetical protein